MSSGVKLLRDIIVILAIVVSILAMILSKTPEADDELHRLFAVLGITLVVLMSLFFNVAGRK